MPQRQIPTPHPPIGGLVQSFLYPTQTPPVRALARQQPPPTPSVPILGASIATTTDSFIFQVTPARTTRRSFRVGTKVAAITGAIRDVTADTILTYTLLQPDRQRIETQPVRYRQDVWAPQYSVFVPTVNTDFWTSPPPAPVPLPLRLQVPAWWDRSGPGQAALPADVFVLNVTPDGVLASYRERPKPIITLRGIRGPAVPVQNPPAVPPPPSDRWWRRLEPARTPVFAVLPGAPTAATFLYPVSQPELRGWFLRRLAQFSVPPNRFDGVEPQALYLYPLAGPLRAAWYPDRTAALLAKAPPRSEGTITIATPAQTSVFGLGQPVRLYWSLIRAASAQPASPLMGQATATLPAPSIPPAGILSLPTRRWWREGPGATMPGVLLVLDDTTIPSTFKVWFVEGTRLIGLKEPE